eukprot:scaffold244853_cov38-Prasinocladus_malaysianus.AAC.1
MPWLVKLKGYCNNRDEEIGHEIFWLLSYTIYIRTGLLLSSRTQYVSELEVSDTNWPTKRRMLKRASINTMSDV